MLEGWQLNRIQVRLRLLGFRESPERVDGLESVICYGIEIEGLGELQFLHYPFREQARTIFAWWPEGLNRCWSMVWVDITYDQICDELNNYLEHARVLRAHYEDWLRAEDDPSIREFGHGAQSAG
jgi:hypothetical protein